MGERLSVFITGAGRSGTSLAANLFSKTHFQGNDLLQPRESNPKGFFESKNINMINEAIIGTKCDDKFGQRWISRLEEPICEDADMFGSIKSHIDKNPFAYKDPRFSYTLPTWLNKIKDHKNIAVLIMFRNPWEFVESLRKECESMEYLSDWDFSEYKALLVWVAMYKSLFKIVEKYDKIPYLCIDYNNLVTDISVVSRIEMMVGCELFRGAIDKSLYRSKILRNKYPPKEVMEIYETLKKLESREEIKHGYK